jgi:hypothetical protein
MAYNRDIFTLPYRYVHHLYLYNSKLSESGCIFYHKLPNNGNNNQLKKKFKDLFSYSVQDYLNEEFCNIGYW